MWDIASLFTYSIYELLGIILMLNNLFIISMVINFYVAGKYMGFTNFLNLNYNISLSLLFYINVIY